LSPGREDDFAPGRRAANRAREIDYEFVLPGVAVVGGAAGSPGRAGRRR
jgi:hypothetical protein